MQITLELSLFQPATLVRLANAIANAMDDIYYTTPGDMSIRARSRAWRELDSQYNSVLDALHGLGVDPAAVGVHCPEE